MFPYCQFKAGTETADAPRRHRACRAMPTFEVAATRLTARVTGFEMRGWFAIGDFCTGHAITVCAADSTRAMRPLAATVETLAKR